MLCCYVVLAFWQICCCMFQVVFWIESGSVSVEQNHAQCFNFCRDKWHFKNYNLPSFLGYISNFTIYVFHVGLLLFFNLALGKHSKVYNYLYLAFLNNKWDNHSQSNKPQPWRTFSSKWKWVQKEWADNQPNHQNSHKITWKRPKTPLEKIINKELNFTSNQQPPRGHNVRLILFSNEYPAYGLENVIYLWSHEDNAK